MAPPEPWVSNNTAQAILTYVHYAYPIVLLLLFLLAFTIHSVLTASKDDVVEPVPDQTGPGGKPLPRNISPSARKQKQKVLDFSPARKLVFGWLSIGVILTFLGNAVTVIVHALVEKTHEWWCGQSTVVCRLPCYLNGVQTDVRTLDLSCCLILRIRTISHLHTRYKTFTDCGPLLYMDHWSDSGIGPLWCVSGYLHVRSSRTHGRQAR